MGEEQLRDAWRQKVRESHPDRGGDPEEFDVVVKAYEVLSDPDLRQRYDAILDEHENVDAKDAEAVLVEARAKPKVQRPRRFDVLYFSVVAALMVGSWVGYWIRSSWVLAALGLHAGVCSPKALSFTLALNWLGACCAAALLGAWLVRPMNTWERLGGWVGFVVAFVSIGEVVAGSAFFAGLDAAMMICALWVRRSVPRTSTNLTRI